MPGCVVQVPTMSATPCLTLLSVLETGTSGHDQLQAKADKLAAAACDRLCKLLVAGTSMAESGEQQQLLQYLGPMQVMLNSERRRKLFARIPFGLLRVSQHLPDGLAGTSVSLAAARLWQEAVRLPECRRIAFLLTTVWMQTPRPQVVLLLLLSWHVRAPVLAPTYSLVHCAHNLQCWRPLPTGRSATLRPPTQAPESASPPSAAASASQPSQSACCGTTTCGTSSCASLIPTRRCCSER